MRIKNKHQYQAILILGAILMTMQIFTLENRVFWAFFYKSSEHQRKMKRKLTPGYETKFSDVCDLKSKDTVPFKQMMKEQRRKLQINLGDGKCKWGEAKPFDKFDRYF